MDPRTTAKKAVNLYGKKSAGIRIYDDYSEFDAVLAKKPTSSTLAGLYQPTASKPKTSVFAASLLNKENETKSFGIKKEVKKTAKAKTAKDELDWTDSELEDYPKAVSKPAAKTPKRAPLALFGRNANNTPAKPLQATYKKAPKVQAQPRQASPVFKTPAKHLVDRTDLHDSLLVEKDPFELSVLDQSFTDLPKPTKTPARKPAQKKQAAKTLKPKPAAVQPHKKSTAAQASTSTQAAKATKHPDPLGLFSDSESAEDEATSQPLATETQFPETNYSRQNTTIANGTSSESDTDSRHRKQRQRIPRTGAKNTATHGVWESESDEGSDVESVQQPPIPTGRKPRRAPARLYSSMSDLESSADDSGSNYSLSSEEEEEDLPSVSLKPHPQKQPAAKLKPKSTATTTKKAPAKRAAPATTRKPRVSTTVRKTTHTPSVDPTTSTSPDSHHHPSTHSPPTHMHSTPSHDLSNHNVSSHSPPTHPPSFHTSHTHFPQVTSPPTTHTHEPPTDPSPPPTPPTRSPSPIRRPITRATARKTGYVVVPSTSNDSQNVVAAATQRKPARVRAPATAAKRFVAPVTGKKTRAPARKTDQAAGYDWNEQTLASPTFHPPQKMQPALSETSLGPSTSTPTKSAAGPSSFESPSTSITWSARKGPSPKPVCIESPIAPKPTGSTLCAPTPRHRSRLPATATPLEVLLAECAQTHPVTMARFLGKKNIEQAVKIGEGSFAEVYSCPFNGESVAVKIMPFGGSRAEDGDWKHVEDVLQEVVMTSLLNDLRNMAPNFIELKKVGVCHGPFDATLLERWDDYDATGKSENDRPDDFEVDQLFVVFVFANGGRDVEHATFGSYLQATSVLQQIVLAMAIAEQELRFEHRDLHWGNVLVGPTPHKHITYTDNGQKYVVETHGVSANIIDNTLSRLEHEGRLLFYNLAAPSQQDLFTGKGDMQFDVYRDMKKATGNDWSSFCPATNVLWVRYMADKLVNEKKYPRAKGVVMTKEKQRVKAFMKRALQYDSCTSLISDEYLQLQPSP